MKCVTRNHFIFLLILFPIILFAQDIPNAGFENWTGGAPDDWLPNDLMRVSQSSDVHGGSYSVKLRIMEDGVGLYGGKIDAGSNGMGFDYFQRPNKLTGYFKLTADSSETGDHLWADVWLYKDGGTTLVGHGQEAIAQPAPGWREFSVTIFYILPDSPDRCQLQIFIGYGPSQSDTTSRVVWVDDLHFEFTNGVEEISGNIPNQFELMQNYPNPFNPSTKIEFAIPEKSFIRLEIYNSLGERIETLISDEFDAGTYNYDWNANGLPSGVYFYTLNAGNFFDTKKFVLLK